VAITTRKLDFPTVPVYPPTYTVFFVFAVYFPELFQVRLIWVRPVPKSKLLGIVVVELYRLDLLSVVCMVQAAPASRAGQGLEINSGIWTVLGLAQWTQLGRNHRIDLRI